MDIEALLHHVSFNCFLMASKFDSEGNDVIAPAIVNAASMQSYLDDHVTVRPGWVLPTGQAVIEAIPDYESMVAERPKIVVKEKLADLRNQAKAKYVTPGKDAEYMLKRAEALGIIADGAPTDENYPIAAERAARKGVTLNDVATEWKIKSDQLVGVLLPALEGAYEAAVEAIDAEPAGEDLADRVNAIVSAVEWP